jgi:hypothetical protein
MRLATSRKKAGTKPDLPEDKSRYIKRSDALALLAQGGWTRDSENDMSYVRDAYVSDRGELLFLMKHGRSIIYESRKAHMEWGEAFDKLPRSTHVLEGLLPQGPHFIEAVPSLVDELAGHLKLPREALDGSFESLHVVDEALKKIRPRRRILETPNFFAGIIAYTGEVLRKESGGFWKLIEVGGDIHEPYIFLDEREFIYINPFLEPYKAIAEHKRGGLAAIVAGLLMAKGLGDRAG